MEERYDGENWLAFIAEMDGEPAGYAICKIYSRAVDSTIRAHRMLYLHRIGVAPYDIKQWLDGARPQ